MGGQIVEDDNHLTVKAARVGYIRAVVYLGNHHDAYWCGVLYRDVNGVNFVKMNLQKFFVLSAAFDLLFLLSRLFSLFLVFYFKKERKKNPCKKNYKSNLNHYMIY